MKRLILFLIIIMLKENISFASIQNKILVNIGNQIITSYELKNRVKTILILNGHKYVTRFFLPIADVAKNNNFEVMLIVKY